MRHAKIASKRHVSLATACSLLALALPACTGIVSSSGSASTTGNRSNGGGTLGGNTTGSTTTTGGTTQTQAAPPFSPAPEAMHRLTKSQFQNSLTALLGNFTISQIEGDSYIGGFATVGAGSVVTSSCGVQEYQTAIDAALDQVFADSARRNALITRCPPPTFITGCSRRT